MREFIVLLSPQWWIFKNRLFHSDWTTYVKAVFMLLFGAAFWAGALHFLFDILERLQGMENNVGNIVALKGLSLLLMLVFFLLIFSSLLSSIKNFYLSPDLPVLLSAPVSWNSIYLAKWFETAIKSSWMILFAILPVFIAFGLYFKTSIAYYITLVPVLVMFIFLSAGIGIMTGILLMALLPARRAKNIFVILGILTLGLLFMLFRLLRPERFANPEWFANMTIFLSEMKAPAAVYLPSMWAVETLAPFFQMQGGVPQLFMLLLFFTALVFIIFGNRLFNAFYYTGLVKAQQTQRPWLISYEDAKESGIRLFSSRYLFSSLLRSCSAFFRRDRAVLIEKDVTTFFRNIGQSSQLLLLFAIIIIYLFSIKALPVDWGNYLSVQLRYIISFFNIGVVGFLITAVAARLVLLSIDSEGPAFWMIRISPVSIRRYIWSKFLIAFFPLLITSQILVIVSNLFLGVKIWFMALGIGTCVVLSASITGLAVGIGASTARFSPGETEREQTGIQGTVFMLSALALIVLTILFELIPTTGIFQIEISRASFTAKGWTIMGASFLSVFVLNAIVLWVVMRIGEKRLMRLESA